MKKILFLLLFFCSQAFAFSGYWISQYNNDTYKLYLKENKNVIVGRYCFITNNGNRIDCEDNDVLNIKGHINGNVADVYFMSTFGGSGTARIIKEKNKLIWVIEDSKLFDDANMNVKRKIIFIRSK